MREVFRPCFFLSQRKKLRFPRKKVFPPEALFPHLNAFSPPPLHPHHFPAYKHPMMHPLPSNQPASPSNQRPLPSNQPASPSNQRPLPSNQRPSQTLIPYHLNSLLSPCFPLFSQVPPVRRRKRTLPPVTPLPTLTPYHLNFLLSLCFPLFPVSPLFLPSPAQRLLRMPYPITLPSSSHHTSIKQSPTLCRNSPIRPPNPELKRP